MIKLEITDSSTGKVTVVHQSVHDAKRLYLALNELFGDAQYKAKPGQLITFPKAVIKPVSRMI